MRKILFLFTIIMCIASPAYAQDVAVDVHTDVSGAISQPQKVRVLSNERTLTRWAYVNTEANVYQSPTDESDSIGRLQFYTSEHMPEVYVVLKSAQQGATQWVQIRIPGRPNGLTGWVVRSSLGDYHVVRKQLIINRKTLKATLYNKGKVVWSTVIGVGAASTPTPAGNFYIRERIPNSWGSYGPFAFGTSAYSSLSEWPGGGVIGIHGTNQPALLPGRVSHGCIRMPNSKIMQLRDLVTVGTPIKIV